MTADEFGGARGGVGAGAPGEARTAALRALLADGGEFGFLDPVGDDGPWCRACSYVPPDAVEADTEGVMPVGVARGPVGDWSAVAHGMWGESTTFVGSAGWDAERARDEVERWLGESGLVRLSAWVPVSSGGWHTHCLSGHEVVQCSACGCGVVDSVMLSVWRGDREVFEDNRLDLVLCSNVRCLARVMGKAREFQCSTVVTEFPVWPGAGS